MVPWAWPSGSPQSGQNWTFLLFIVGAVCVQERGCSEWADPGTCLCSPNGTIISGFIGYIKGRQGAKSNNCCNVPWCVYFLSRERNNDMSLKKGYLCLHPRSLICHILASRIIFLKHQSTSQVLHKQLLINWRSWSQELPMPVFADKPWANGLSFKTMQEGSVTEFLFTGTSEDQPGLQTWVHQISQSPGLQC